MSTVAGGPAGAPRGSRPGSSMEGAATHDAGPSVLRIFALFHLNLAFSSIEEEERPQVVERCYWPLLRLVEDLGVPLGIELTGATLDTLATIDPTWVASLRALLHAGRCELIGSGRAQLIGPLVPAAVVAANLRLGLADYDRHLGVRPRLALVNEQAWSGGLVRHYLAAGFDAVVMEWDNAWRHHPDWDPTWRYQAQTAVGPDGEGVPVVFSKSITFQKLQRYAHEELEVEELLSYYEGHVGDDARYLCAYSNDAEIFDFRPGRFSAEPPPAEESEWARLRRLFVRIAAHRRLTFVPPSAVLDDPTPRHRLRLESPEQPIPVKKQGKYNVVRWAVTGRDDLGLNTRCLRLLGAARSIPPGDPRWTRLCDLWASDLRTHITPSRWARALAEATALEEALGVSPPLHAWLPLSPLPARAGSDGRTVDLETAAVRVRLNQRRGLSLSGVWFGGDDGPPMVGTLSHGYYDDIGLGADWYTGHLVAEAPGRPRVTDLERVAPLIGTLPDGDVAIEAVVPTPLGPVRKRVVLGAREPRVDLLVRLDWPALPVGTLRLGHVTLVPDAWDHETLHFVTTNGGAPEAHALAGHTFDHGAPVSFLVSANGGLGLTEGWVELRDARRGLRVEVDRERSSLIGLVSHREVGGTFFCRVTLTAGELDDTRAAPTPLSAPLDAKISLRPAP